MSKKMLAVCHSIGDSQVIFESAKEMAKSKIASSILVVGTTARTNIQKLISDLNNKEILDQQKLLALEDPVLLNSWFSLADQILVQDIDSLLTESMPIQKSLSKLESSDIESITQQLRVSDYSALLMGTPSYIKGQAQCDIAEQLLTAWAPLVHSAVVSDYAFYDPEHHLATNRWFEKAMKFLLPFNKAKEAFSIPPALDELVAVVGHPSVDMSKNLYREWENERVNDFDPRISLVREKLSLQEDEKFIFVAGGKAGDELMIQALANTCKNYPEIKIFLGMHPAASSEYLEKIQLLLDYCKVSEQIKFIAKGISTDEAVYAANGVMTVTSTVGTTASAYGKPVVFYQEGKSVNDPSIPYIVAENKDTAFFCTESAALVPFYECIRKNANKTKAEEKVEENTAAENIATEMKKLINMR